MGGSNVRYIVSTLLTTLVFGYIATFRVEVGHSRINRIVAFIDPLGDLEDKGWQLSQSLAAVPNSSFFGSGLGTSKRKFLYLSQAHDDFIFAVTCEESGFLRALTLIITHFASLVCGTRTAMKTKCICSKLLVSGILFVIRIQTYASMTIVTGLIPSIELTLPSIPYGGTSLMIMLGPAGIILGVDKNNKGERK